MKTDAPTKNLLRLRLCLVGVVVVFVCVFSYIFDSKLDMSGESVHIKVQKAYPSYFGSYYEPDKVKSFLSSPAGGMRIFLQAQIYRKDWEI
jgi:hypothetical protein